VTAFERLFAQAETDTERLRLTDQRKRSGAGNDDPLWSFVWVFEEAVTRLDRTLAGLTVAAKAEEKAALARTQAMVTAHVTSRVDMAQFNAQLRRYALWVIGGTLGTMLAGFVILAVGLSGLMASRMEDTATLVAEASRIKMQDALTAVVADEVAKGLRIGMEHKAELVTLLRLEGASPGTLGFTASVDGQFMRRMYLANGSKVCALRRVVSNTDSCINQMPPDATPIR